jgi:ubiquinone/menaquinone biosynthesis C-methylase UbiE
MMDDCESTEIPGYQPQLAAYHRAFGRELRTMLEDLPLRLGDCVLDMACGDGTYTSLLASRVGNAGRVVACDVNSAYLDLTRESIERAGPIERVELIQGSIEHLPLTPGRFDGAWCAQSLFSLPEPLTALQALRRVVRPGGWVAVVENDTLHQVILPWPVEVELATRAAEFAALADETSQPRKFYTARRMGAVFHEAGLVRNRLRTYSHDRQAPLDPDVREYLVAYLAELRDRVSHRLGLDQRDRFEQLADPTSPTYLLDTPHLTCTIVDHLMCGQVPDGS